MASHRSPAAVAGAILALCVMAGCERQAPHRPVTAVYVDAARLEASDRPAALLHLPAVLPPPHPLTPLPLVPFPSTLSIADLLAPAPEARTVPVLDAAKERLQQLEGFVLARAERILERERAQAQRLVTRARIEGQQRLTRDLAVAEAQREADLRSVRNRFGAPLLALEGTLRRVAADPDASARIAAEISDIQSRLAAEEARARYRDAQRRTASAERYQEYVAEAEQAIAANIEQRAAELRADAFASLAEHRAAILATTIAWRDRPAGTLGRPLPTASSPREVRQPAFLRYKALGPVRLADGSLTSALLDAKRANIRLQAEAAGRAAGWRVVFEDGAGLPDRTRELETMLRHFANTRAASDGDFVRPVQSQ